jgi:hypothetical protein
MTMKISRISNACRSLFVGIFTILLASGCATIDKTFFPPTPSPSVTDSTPSSSPESSASPSTPKPSSSDSQNADNSNDEKELDRLVKSKGCNPPNQVEYVHGNYKIGWTFATIRHEGLLNMNGRVGKMRIKFFDRASSSTSEVDQMMVLASCTKGLVLIGFNPVVAGTSEKAANYITDNLIFRRETGGEVTMLNCYEEGCSPIEMQQVSNK